MANNLKQHIGYWLNRLRSAVHQAFEKRLDAYAITIAQWCVLIALYDERADSVNGLAKYIEIDKASISRVVKRLVEKKFITHQAGKDGRCGYLSLTPSGYKLIPLLINEAEENEKQFFSSLTDAEKAVLQCLVSKIITNIPSISTEGWIMKHEDSNEQ